MFELTSSLADSSSVPLLGSIVALLKLIVRSLRVLGQSGHINSGLVRSGPFKSSQMSGRNSNAMSTAWSSGFSLTLSLDIVQVDPKGWLPFSVAKMVQSYGPMRIAKIRSMTDSRIDGDKEWGSIPSPG